MQKMGKGGGGKADGTLFQKVGRDYRRYWGWDTLCSQYPDDNVRSEFEYFDEQFHCGSSRFVDNVSVSFELCLAQM